MINTMYLKVTEGCNLKCPFCYVTQKKSLLDKETAFACIEKYRPETIIFHGGEPLLSSETIELEMAIMDRFPEINYSITSNLSMPLTSDRLQVLNRCSIATSYSVDRFKEQGMKLFKKNLELLNKDHDITLLVTLSRPQLKEAPEKLAEIIKSLGCRYVLFERLFEDGAGRELYEATDEYLLALMKLIPEEQNVLLHQMMEAIELHVPVFSTTCDCSVVTINSDGSTQACPNTCKIKRKTLSHRECLNCPANEYCRGDCLSFQTVCSFPIKTFTYIKENCYGCKNR